MSSDLVSKAAQLRQEFDQEVSRVSQAATSRAVEDLRVASLGRKGTVTALMESLREVPKEQRPEAGKAVNVLRQHIESQLEHLKTLASKAELSAQLNISTLDVSLPATPRPQLGSLHPVTLIRRELVTAFRRMGFTIYDGPEADTDFYNFSALNFPDHHPARDMQDTFFLKNYDQTLLRTHTSNIQIHAMFGEKPPIRAVAFGRTFRCDSDITHTPMFHQMECFVVDQDISMSHLKGLIETFLREIYGEGLKTRFRPSFFPFVEPGAEVDLQCSHCSGKGCRICKNTGWIEIGGCGMIHPNVFEAVGYDSETYTGFAFGFGMDRIAMNKFALPDLRQLFAGEQDFLGQFPVMS